ncbi:6-carboxyhexanoate--CoA ligase [Dictyobacter vulcani]|uniref:6-carboxyhexanoate--CoA ligase n=1 Tax=Dictyobacter vulcani TaxID=2607529 RepID=A0A5J4KRR5_9CHLR|nr:acetate--CoA ligase family protein [Dictyobacter vulcani]GER89100.1 6-carboxyhexanoate--CoA ligase [Dictyobacter vulcani]
MEAVTGEQLQRLFRPRSIALIGATDNSRWSIYTFDNLNTFGFTGPIYLVNPNREIIHGQRAYKSLHELPEVVDLAFVMVSTRHVLSIVQEAAALGTARFVLLTSGFSESGPEGASLEQELLSFARTHELTILGPNGNGFINITDQITPYGLPIAPPLKAGPVGVVLQSGALASAVLSFAQAHAIGLSLLVALGNESMISVTDVVDYLLEDETTHAIALFLECVRQPSELRRVAARARQLGKTIVVLKIGSSDASSRSARAHTGALVGDNVINDVAFRELGMIRVSSLEDLLTTAGLAGYTRPLPGRRMGVVTPSGGACDIISDLAQEVGLEIPDFAPQTVERLQTILPAFSTSHNPLDVTGYVVVDPTLQQRALEIVATDPNIDFILYLTTVEGSREPTPETLAILLPQYDNLSQIISAATCPILLTTNTCIDLPTGMRMVVERTGMHFMAGLDHGVRALGKFAWWSDQKDIVSVPAPVEESRSIHPDYIPAAGSWSEMQARHILQQAGIPVVPGQLATSADEAVQAAREFGLPVVLKIQSADILHKSDVGGVRLNVASEQEIRQEFAAILQRVQQRQPDAIIEGILVTPMRLAGNELLVSVVCDPLWGPILTLGLGGIWTEVFKDTAVCMLPVTREQIPDMLCELRSAPLLQGARGQPRVDMQALCEVIYRISRLALSFMPHLSVLEINPLLVHATRIEVLDVLITWQE